MSNIANVAVLMNAVNMIKNPETDTSSLSSTTSDPEIFNPFESTEQPLHLQLQSPELFELKYEGKYIDFTPYKGNYNLREYPPDKCRYEYLPKMVFGKIEIKDKHDNKTLIYGTFKKRHIRVKK